jgi:NADH-quinone oxidoreductase subunit H
MSPDRDALAFGPQLRELIGSLYGTLLGRPTDDSLVVTAENVTMWVLLSVVILVGLIVAMLYSTWIERKFVGRIQDRFGPNRVGPFGLLQPFADMVKILTKEDITPEPAHRWVFNLGSLLVVPPALIVFGVIPFGIGLVASELSVGFLFFIAISSLIVVPLFMAGWGSRNKYSLLGAMRAVAQIVSYEIPQVLSVVGVLLMAGTLSLQGLTFSQGPISAEGYPSFPGVWFVLVQPVAFVIFLLATAAEIERTPFDIPEAESEIIAGYYVEYSGIKFGMFYLAIYFATIAAAALGAALFLGGWQPPISALSFIPGPFWFAGKTLLFILLFMWLRGTLPRFRVDQLMSIAWKILVPLALANLLIAALVGKITHDVQLSAAEGSFQATPWFVLLGFTLANILLVIVTLALATWWRGRGGARGVPSLEPELSEVSG